MDNLKEILQEVGLSDKESQVYLSLLALGPSTVNDIAERADLIRTTTYDLLKTLREKALVSFARKNKVIHYTAADPSKIIETLDEKKQKVKSVLKELRSLHNPKPKSPVIELFEGMEGIRTVWQDILHKKKDLLCISDYESLFNTTKFFAPRFINQRVEHKIPARLLTEKTKGAVEVWKNKDKKELRKTKFLQGLNIMSATEYIYGNNVAILGTDVKNPLAFIIRHKDFANHQRNLFELLWEKAEN
jgi:HTH-type transcriptional regulator, sugar sensing transcriptional regulator